MEIPGRLFVLRGVHLESESDRIKSERRDLEKIILFQRHFARGAMVLPKKEERAKFFFEPNSFDLFRSQWFTEREILKETTRNGEEITFLHRRKEVDR